jgi:hypothetical protein
LLRKLVVALGIGGKQVSVQPAPDKGINQPDEAAAQNLAATRTVRVAADELGSVFGRYGLGIALCIFGIAFAGFAVGLRDADPEAFDLSILLTIFGFATALLVFGVFVAILREETSQKATPTKRQVKRLNRQATAGPAPAATSVPSALGEARPLAEQTRAPDVQQTVKT